MSMFCSHLRPVMKIVAPFRLYSRSFVSGHTFKMPITELVFPKYKLDAQSLTGLKEKAPKIFQSFSGVEGLQAAFPGAILEENGATIDPNSMRSVLVLEWDKSSSFHTFFPNSHKFESFVRTIKPFVAAPVTPELYEAEERSISCTSSNITQIIKVTSTKGTEDTWKQLEGAITESATDKPSFYHANGIEKNEGTFLGLVGWKSLQEYERVGKDSNILERVGELTNGGKSQNIVAQIVPLSNI